MNTFQKLTVVALSALGGLLLVAFFVVYLGNNDVRPVELTANQPESAGAVVSESSPVSPESADGSGRNAPGQVSQSQVRVYVAGSVGIPGVYPMEEGDRLIDAVEAAGGATGNADLEMVNLAVKVEDEGFYFIPEKVEPIDVEAGIDGASLHSLEPKVPPLAANPSTGQMPTNDQSPDETSSEDGGPIDLNLATQAELESLPGIGPARSRAIIAYREQNGPFAAVDEITAVSGIGQGILENLDGLITVDEAP